MKSDFTSRLKYGVSAIAVATILPFGIQASYAADDAAAEEEVTFEEVVVTGSRIKRKDIESISPITILGTEDIQMTGLTRMEDVLNSLPSLEAGQNSNIANGSSGTADLNLRGFGPDRTLVLVNGRRMQPGGIFSTAPDINQIASGLIQQVEVLTGGASTTYGADAVAGVVNFVMDKNFEGVRVSGGIAAYQHNNDNQFMQGLLRDNGFDVPSGSVTDGTQYNFDVTFGGSFADGKGHATVYANWRKQNEIRQGSRDYSAGALNGSGTDLGGSANAVIPNFFISPVLNVDTDLDGDGIIGAGETAGSTNFDEELFLTLQSDGSLADFTDNFYNFAPINHFQRPDERWATGAFVNYEINDHIKPYLEVNFSRDTTAAQIAESGTFFAEEYRVKCDSPLLSAAQQTQICGGFGLDTSPGTTDEIGVYIGKRNVEGGPRKDNLIHTGFRIVLGSEGEINDNWNYDASFLYASTNSSTTYQNDFFAPNITAAVDQVLDTDGQVVCASGGDCIPYRVFDFEGVTPEQAAGLTGTGILGGTTKEYVVNAFVTGELPFTMPTAENAVSVVFGVEYRKEVFQRIADKLFENGELLGQGGATASVDGAYDVREFFTEAVVPLVENVEFAKLLELELGFRQSGYETSADTSYATSTYKAGANWQIVDEVKVRGGYNRSVRAPNVVELFLPQTLGLWGGIDPCAGANATLTAAQCENTGLSASNFGKESLVSPAGQYNGFFGGNPELEPEVADTYNIGIVANPVEGLNLTVDYWNIKIKGVIGGVSPELAITQCGITADPVFCNLVQRSPSGSLWQGQVGRVVATQQNLGFEHQQGIDVTGSYVIDGFGGTFRADMVGTLLLMKEEEQLPGVASSFLDCKGLVTSDCGLPSPEWRHTARLSYSTDNWSLNTSWRYFGSVDNPDVDTGLNAGIAAQSYFDIAGSYDITENVTIDAGIRNIFDKEPPLIGDSLKGTEGNANTFAGYYDTLGRYLHANITAKF